MAHYELFAFWRSSATYRVRVALNLKGLSAHEHAINLDADILLASIVAVMRALKISVAEIPVIDRIMARCESLDAFARADPFSQAGAPST